MLLQKKNIYNGKMAHFLQVPVASLTGEAWIKLNVQWILGQHHALSKPDPGAVLHGTWVALLLMWFLPTMPQRVVMGIVLQMIKDMLTERWTWDSEEWRAYVACNCFRRVVTLLLSQLLHSASLFLLLLLGALSGELLCHMARPALENAL